MVLTHPNPQFARKDFSLLDGSWDFSFTCAKKAGRAFSSDETQALDAYKALGESYEHTIRVPFCIQSALSGIGITDFIGNVAYRKTVNIRKNGRRVFLHIGAADYLTTVLVNGIPVGRHKGGYTSFSFDITDAVTDGENELFIYCEDDERNGLVCTGKQSNRNRSYGCLYTRTTGIWQSVYLEYTPQDYIRSFRIYPDIENGSITVCTELCGEGTLTLNAYYEGEAVGNCTANNASGSRFLTLKLDRTELWEPGCGRLYELELKFGNDTVYSYFGLREIRLDGMRFLINGKSVFQRLVLDQGFYPDGVYTAKDDETMLADIRLSMALGFNGARLHEKVFDPRFLYYCDREGYLTWGEYPNWGLNHADPRAVDTFLAEWGEAVSRDFNHPSIIGWCPFNETWDVRKKPQYDPLLSAVYDYTKAVDCTRPCIDTSGNFHVKTDIFDLHDYRCDPKEFKASFDRFVTENYLYQHVNEFHPGRQEYRGEPVFISEYGGIKWETDKTHKSWGYGNDVVTEEEWLARYKGLTEALLQNPKFFGFCYTQLYDVEQEQNGLYSYDRRRKFSDKTYEQIKAVNTQKAAIE